MFPGCRTWPRLEIIAADLEDGSPWPLAAREFDGIVVTNYLHRPLFPHLATPLAPGGVLIYETFGVGNERFGKPSNPNFLLRPGELLEFAAAHGLQCWPMRAARSRAEARDHAADGRATARIVVCEERGSCCGAGVSWRIEVVGFCKEVPFEGAEACDFGRRFGIPARLDP